MFSFAENILNPLDHACEKAEEVGIAMQERLAQQFRRAQHCAAHAYQVIRETYKAMDEGYQTSAKHLKHALHRTLENVKAFASRNKEAIFCVGCSLLTAYFAPTLFLPTAIITLILRFEFSRYSKKIADSYLKDECNPYKLHPRYQECVNPLELTMSVIAAADAIALGTIFVTNSLSIALIPVLGGIAAGSCAAKFCMNV